MNCQNNTTNHSPCPTESSQSSTLEPSLEQSYVFGVHASAIPGREEPQESTQEYSSPVCGKHAIPIDVADIPFPEGGKKKLNIPLTNPLAMCGNDIVLPGNPTKL